MGLISSSLPNFVNGVSQQPFTLRMASQGEVQENGLSTVAQGLKKRPGTKHLRKIISGASPNSFIHIINRDVNERYVIVIDNQSLKVFDLQGNVMTVNAPDGLTYLTTGAPQLDIRAVTVADYTFLVNRAITVGELAASSTVNPVRNYEALINVKAGNYGKTYAVYVNGTASVYSTPDGSNANQSPQISTDYIASQLVAQLTTNLPGWTIYQTGSVIYLRNPSADFTLSCDDGFNGNAMVTIKNRLQKFSDLPNRCPVDGFTVEIVGDSNSTFDNYFVKYDSSVNTGVWKETCKPGISAGVNPLTMPFALVREANGSFTFKKNAWKSRLVGDTDSNPNPSFTGRKLNDVFFYRNRLGFLSDENVIFSEAGKYFNLYRTTVIQLLDSDPIDVSVSHTKVSVLEHAVPFNKQLLLFSAQTQFILDQNELLTPKTVSIKQSTEFPCNIVAKPVGVGKNIYFTVDKGDWSAVREYYADFNNVSNDSSDITGHVPKYIPSGVFKITTAPNEDVMVFLSKNNGGEVYVYKYFWANNEKLQSSWSRWTFGPGDVVLNVEFIQSELVFVIQRSDGVYLEKMDIALGAMDSNENFQTLLDRRHVVPKASLAFDGTYTSWNPVVEPLPGEEWQIVTATGGTTKANIVKDVTFSAGIAKVEGNVTGSDLIVGRKYLFKYTLSTITVKQAQPGGGQKSDTEGRLQLRKIAVNYADTGYFTVKVKPQNRDTYVYKFSGKVLGNVSATLGKATLSTGRMIIPVMTRNTDTSISFENDSPVPCSFLSADWEGFYVKRSQPV
jgi:hypothetical protein